MSTNGSARLIARVLVPVGVVGAVVGAAAVPAFADSTVTVNGGASAEIDSHAVVSIAGHYDNSTSPTSKPLQLVVTDPSGGAHVIYSGTAGAFAKGTIPTQSFDTSCQPWATTCIEPDNGDYSFVVKLGSAPSTPATVWLRLPAAKVANFRAGPAGTVANFSWSADTDPGLTGYDVRDSSGSVTPGGLDPSSVCDSSGCSVSIQFGSGVAGTSRSFTVLATRRDGHGGTVTSDPADWQTVNFPAPSTGGGGGGGGGSTGSGSGSGSGGGSGSTGGTHQTTGGGGTGSSTGSGSARRLHRNHPAADLRTFLPTASAGAAPDLPSVLTEVKPLPEGTYKPTLAYPDQVSREALKKPTTVAATVQRDLNTIIDSGPLWRAIAGAALLMLVAAHLRAWTERVELD
jgi:hypothetical protein